jgi:hypothetical protein
MRNLGWLCLGVLLGGVLCLQSAQAADFTGGPVETSNTLLGVGVAICFGIGWLCGGQR